jgi:hypothetical protein
VDGTPALGVFGPKLAQDLGRARDNEEAAQEFCATSNLKRARQRLKQALDATMQYGHHLSTRAARKKLPLTLQQDFLGAGVPIENDLKTLKTAVHCPSDAAG